MKVALLALMLISLEVSAQGVFSNHTSAAIEKVIQDYPNQFINIRGALLLQNQQTADYQSSIQIPGALSCQVIKYNSTQKEGVCWKAKLFQTSNFNEAKEKYRELYNQIRNSIVRVEGEKPYILNGQYEIPTEKKNIHSVVFSMLPSTGQMQKLKVQLTLVQHGSTWKIGLMVYDGFIL
jgi:hypothetical protein